MTESIGHDMGNEVMTWLAEMQGGHDTERMARGKHFYFNCDSGKNHYVYEVDESRHEIRRDGKQGRKKRAYVGTLSSRRGICDSEATRWEKKHVCHDQNEGHDSG